MDFRDYAAKETSSAVGRLLAAQSDAAVQHLRAVRDALDAATHAFETASAFTPNGESEIQELVRRLNAAAASAMRAAAQRVQDEARTLIDAAHAEAESERARGEQLDATVAELQGRVDDLHAELQIEKDRAEAALHDLTLEREAREESEAARRHAETESTHLSDMRTALEDDLRETRGLLDAALSEAAQLTAQLEVEGAERASLGDSLRELRDRQREIEAAREAAETTARAEVDARVSLEHQLLEANRSLDHAIAEASRLTMDLEARDSERSSLAAEANAAREELAAVRADRDALGVQVDALHLQMEGMTAQLDAARARIGVLERSQADHEEIIRGLESSLETASQAGARLREQLTTDGGALADARAANGILIEERDRLASLLDGALRASDELTKATNISGLLASLVTQLASHFSRAALFRLNGNKLEGQHQIGFDLTTDVTKIVVPLNLDSLLTRAVTSGVVETSSDDRDGKNKLAPFGAAAGRAVAIPIVVQKETLAVVYAEESESTSAAVHRAGVQLVELLVRQTVALLMRLTQELKAMTELREYAALLLQEAEQMYLADVEADKTDTEKRRRLKDTIECARQLYAQRAALDGPAAATLLDDHMTATIEAKADTPFARDLTAILGLPAIKASSSRRAAEAS